MRVIDITEPLHSTEKSPMSLTKSRFHWSRSAVVAMSLIALSMSCLAQEPRNLQVGNEPSPVSADLQMIYKKTESASSIADYASIYDFCRNVAGDSTRIQDDKKYAKTLMSWAANRRGEARSDRAGILVREQQFSQAEELDSLALKDFEIAIQLDPSRWRAHHNLAIVRALQKNNKAAIESLDTVLKLNPDFSDAYFNRGEIYFRDNQFELAIQDFSKAIELKPEDSAVYTARAHSLYATGKRGAALADYEKAMELSPDSCEAATEYADTCQALGKWKEAATAYQKAMQLDGQNARAFQNAAWMMATCPDDFYRNGHSALETAQLAVQLSSAPSSVHVLDVLAAAQAAAGDFVSAERTVAEALRSTTDPTLRSELQMRGRQYQRKRPFVQPSLVSSTKAASKAPLAGKRN
jgi:tetratricopeptide (TPR) repeat protein